MAKKPQTKNIQASALSIERLDQACFPPDALNGVRARGLVEFNWRAILADIAAPLVDNPDFDPDTLPSPKAVLKPVNPDMRDWAICGSGFGLAPRLRPFGQGNCQTVHKLGIKSACVFGTRRLCHKPI